MIKKRLYKKMTKKEAAKKYIVARDEYIETNSYKKVDIEKLIACVEKYLSAIKDCHEAGFKNKLEIKRYVEYLRKDYEL